MKTYKCQCKSWIDYVFERIKVGIEMSKEKGAITIPILDWLTGCNTFKIYIPGKLFILRCLFFFTF